MPAPEQGVAERFGPYYVAEPLSGDGGPPVLPPEPSAGPRRWYCISDWQILGPLPQTDGDDPLCLLPDVLPCSSTAYEVGEALAARLKLPDGLVSWRKARSENGTVQAGELTGAKGAAGLAGTVWYAAAELVCRSDREAWVGISGFDSARLWVNERLAWIGREQAVAVRTGRADLVKVALVKGVNRLLVRCRNDRGQSWFRLQVRGVGGVSGAEAAGAGGARATRCWDDADPPLAWDLQHGRNVAWRRDLKAAGPLAPAGDRLLLNVEPHTLACLDQQTGKELWRRESNVLELLGGSLLEEWAGLADDGARMEMLARHLGRRLPGRLAHAAPLTDGKRIWVHYDTALAACYDLDGRRIWMRRTPLAAALTTLTAHGLVIEGQSISGRPGGKSPPAPDAAPKQTHAMICLDAHSGKEVWSTSVSGRSQPAESAAYPFVLQQGRRQFLLTRSGEVFDAADGKPLVCPADYGPWDWPGACQAGNDLFACHTHGQSGVRLWWDESTERMGQRLLWAGARQAAKGGHYREFAVACRGLVFMVRTAVESTKHNPSPEVEMEVYDSASGRKTFEIKPLLKRTIISGPPAAAGGYVFVPDMRAGIHSGDPPATRHVAVVTAEACPRVVARNLTPFVADSPVFCGKRMFIRCEREIACVTVATAQDRRYQDEKLAETLLEEIDSPVPAVSIRDIAPAEGPRIVPGVPIAPLADRAEYADWLMAGPFPAAIESPGQAAGGMAGLPFPAAGAAVTLAATTRTLQPLDPNLLDAKAEFHDTYHLHTWWFRRLRRAIDFARLAGDKQAGAYVLATVVDNARRQVVASTLDRPGLDVWLGGTHVKPHERVRLQPGLYPLVVRVGEAFFHPGANGPLDVAKALQDGALVKVNWPARWKVFGPVPIHAAALDGEKLAAVGDKLVVAGQEFMAHEADCAGASLDLSPLAQLKSGDAGRRLPPCLYRKLRPRCL